MDINLMYVIKKLGCLIGQFFDFFQPYLGKKGKNFSVSGSS